MPLTCFGEMANFYTELLQQLQRGTDNGGEDGGATSSSADSTSALLFCKLDAMPLQRLVGTDRAARMITGQEVSFVFC